MFLSYLNFAVFFSTFFLAICCSLLFKYVVINIHGMAAAVVILIITIVAEPEERSGRRCTNTDNPWHKEKALVLLKIILK